LETSLLISRAVETGPSTTVSFVEVKDHDRQRFLDEHRPSRHDLGHKTADEAAHSLLIPPLNEIWERLSQHPRLQDAAGIHRGVEWQAPFDADRYLSATKKPGFVRGLNSAAGEFSSFQVPSPTYLCTKPEWRRRNSWDLPWDKPKVVMNAVRVSRRAWCIAAFPDVSGLVCTGNFQCLWPKSGWSVNTLSAVLNGPVANAFIASHEGKLHIPKHTLTVFPLPLLTTSQMSELDALVTQYLAAMDGSPSQVWELWQKSGDDNHTRRILLEIDALILRGYNLPPRLERQLLGFFRGERRPVSFEFGNYYPADFTPTIPLWMYISADFQKCTADHLLKTIPKIRDPTLLAALKEVE
jgi:hypothetical protein